MTERPTLYAQFESLPGSADAVSALVRAYAVAVAAEPGNIQFAGHRLAESPDRFFVYEEYATRSDFEAHLASAHCEAFNEAIAPLVVGGGSTLTWLNPVA